MPSSSTSDYKTTIGHTQSKSGEVVERIQFVIERTEHAANETLNQVDIALKLLTEISEDAAGESTKLDQVCNALLNIVSAQEFQDICAQTLEFALLALQNDADPSSVEKNLNTHIVHAHEKSEGVSASDKIAAAGPNFKGTANNTSSQEEIDALLQKNQ